MTRPSALVVALLVAGMAGCAGPAPETPVVPESETASDEPPSALVVLEGCDSSSMITEIPEAWTDPMMPPGADAHELVPYMNIAGLQFWHCSRAQIGTDVREDVAIVEAYVGGSIELSDGNVSGLLVLVLYTNDEALQAVMAEVGINATIAEIRAPRTSPLPGAPALRGWEIHGSDFTVSYEYSSLEATQLRMRSEATFWYLGPPHARGDVNTTDWAGDAWEQDFITMQFEGESRMKTMFGNMNAWPALQQQYYDGHRTYEFTGGFV